MRVNLNQSKHKFSSVKKLWAKFHNLEGLFLKETSGRPELRSQPTRKVPSTHKQYLAGLQNKQYIFILNELSGPEIGRVNNL